MCQIDDVCVFVLDFSGVPLFDSGRMDLDLNVPKIGTRAESKFY